MHRFAFREDCTIDRNHSNYPTSAVLFDCDGEVVFEVSKNWTDDQIWKALEFANHAFKRGYYVGSADRAKAIKKLLDVG